MAAEAVAAAALVFHEDTREFWHRDENSRVVYYVRGECHPCDKNLLLLSGSEADDKARRHKHSTVLVVA